MGNRNVQPVSGDARRMGKPKTAGARMTRTVALLLILLSLTGCAQKPPVSPTLRMSAVTNVELPRVYIDTTYTPPTGGVVTVSAGQDLQAAINSAPLNSTIQLQAGAVWTGNYTLPNKSGSGWLVIKSTGSLPAPGTRVSPANAGAMGRIQSNNAEAALRTDPGAHHYRLIGLEIGVQAGTPNNYGLLKLGDSTNVQTASNTPADFIVDRCYVHGNASGDVIRGIALNSARTAVIDSHISDCHAVGFDSQAVCGWNGPGPFKIVNNYLEGAGENFMLGGADPTVSGLIGSDIEFRQNYVYKPLRWMQGNAAYAGIPYSVKNLFELKNAQRVLIDGNVFENNWQQAQDGFAIVLKVQNQDGGAPWTFTGDITFTNNVVRHSGAGINLLGHDPYQTSTLMKRILIRNNLWDDIDGAAWGATHGRWFQINETADVTVDHNTVIHSGPAAAVITVYALPSQSFVYTNNISRHNEYGVKGDSQNSGTSTINAYFPGAVFTNNILAGGNAAIYPAGNFFPADLNAVGFTNMGAGDYSLTTASAYHNAGTDGLDLGYISGGAPLPSPTSTSMATPSPSTTPSPSPTTTATPSTSPCPSATPCPCATPTPAVTPTPVPMPTPTSAVPVTWTQLTGLVTQGTNLVKAAGCEGCWGSALSSQQIATTGGYAEFVQGAGTTRVGLTRAGETPSTSTIDYSIAVGGAQAAVYENGVYRTEIASANGNTFRVAIENGVIVYRKNNVEFYRSTVAPIYPQVVVGLISSVGGVVSGKVMEPSAGLRFVK